MSIHKSTIIYILLRILNAYSQPKSGWTEGLSVVVVIIFSPNKSTSLRFHTSSDHLILRCASQSPSFAPVVTKCGVQSDVDFLLATYGQTFSYWVDYSYPLSSYSMEAYLKTQCLTFDDDQYIFVSRYFIFHFFFSRLPKIL